MTAKETEALNALRAELVAYHVEVREHIARCEACRSDVATMHADLYGIPGNKEHTGVVGEVSELRASRRAILIGLRCAWGVLVAVAGVVTTVLFGK